MNPPNNSPKHTFIETFDVVRAIAVLLVLLFHSNTMSAFPFPEIANTIVTKASLGQFGVLLFFVLSGFLITRILIANKGKKNAYKNFLIRRSLRIFPIYYLTIFVLFFIEPGQYLFECAAYISNYTFAFDTSRNPMRHTWSLCVEEHFYLFWPPIILFFSTKLSRACVYYIFPAVSIVGALITFQMMGDADRLFYRGTNYQIFAISMGSALAFQETRLRSSPKRSLNAGIFFIASGVLTGLVLGFVAHAPNGVIKFFSYTLISTGIICIALSINDAKSSFYKVATNPALSYIGKISYGLYLYHFPIYYFFGTLNSETATPLLILYSTSVCFVVAVLSFHLIERPILRLKKHFV